MSTHLTEEEQLAALKRWWDDNGRSLIIGVVLAVGVFFGWQAWNNQQAASLEQAATLYEQFSEAIASVNDGELTEEQRVTAINIAEELKDGHANSLFALNAALFIAKLEIQQNNLEAAEEQLRWVLERADDETIGYLARQRLAQVAFAQKNYSDALQLLADTPTGFESTYAELKGDIYLAQENHADALAAYQQALDQLLPTQNNRRNIVQMKLDAVSAMVPEEGTEQVAEEGVEG